MYSAPQKPPLFVALVKNYIKNCVEKLGLKYKNASIFISITAGVDPYARRAIWDLIIKYKKGMVFCFFIGLTGNATSCQAN